MHVQNTLAQILRLGLLGAQRVVVRQAGPEAFALVVVVVKAFAVFAAHAAQGKQFFNHGHRAAWAVAVGEFARLGVARLLGQLDGHFVGNGQRPHGHTGLARAVFNQRGCHTFGQHGDAVVDKRADKAVIDHDRRFAQLGDQVQGMRQALVRGIAPADDFHQRHALGWREKMHANKALRVGAGLG